LLDSFSNIVAHYRREYLPNAKEDERFFGDKSLSPRRAIKKAALSIRLDGRLHDHQHRIGRKGMAAAALALLEYEGVLMSCCSFEELHGCVSQLRGRGLRIGELAAYDISQRIGWYRGLLPTEVYLHCGTRAGARALLKGGIGQAVPVACFPLEFRDLSAAQIEDVLCIYKDSLEAIARRQG
jgi:hypothetical protein